jgi:hypothetical protein
MKASLTSILKKRAPNRDTFRVLVVDTAIGGNGAKDLSEMICEVCADSFFPNIEVTFYLLHDICRGKKAVPRIEAVRSASTDKVRFTVHRHSVRSLIVEDWDEALGIELRLERGVFRVEPRRSPGMFYLRGTGGVRELETSDLSQLLQQKMAESTSDAVRTHPRFTQIGEVWMKYMKP